MSYPNISTFAGGCFWGIQSYFQKHFGKEIISKVGYTGGLPAYKNPSYEKVCGGTTGHAEAVQINYSNNVKYEDLVLFFFRIHNPTTHNRQGNDVGSQYRSAIFYHNQEQLETSKRVIENVKDKFKEEIKTTLEEAQPFYEAEAYHQDYLSNNPSGYCNHKFYW